MTKYLFIAVCLFFVPQFADAAVFYIDFNCDLNPDTECGNGLSTTTPFAGIDDFAEATRSAGDIAYVRRGQASTTNITDVNFTSDGTLNNPITISADYDNLWPDQWASSTPTATPVFGSKFVALSASSTQFQTGNKWIYFQGDCYEQPTTTPGFANRGANPCEFMYEVASTSPNGIDLYLPYKGNQSGSGINMRIASSAPQWNTTTGDFNFAVSQDTNWILKGLDLRSTDTTGAINQVQSTITVFDTVFQTDGVTAAAFRMGFRALLTKIRSFGGNGTSIIANGSVIKDFYIDCNNVASSVAFTTSGAAPGDFFTARDGEITGCTNPIAGPGVVTNSGYDSALFVNVKHTNSFTSISGASPINFSFQDDYGSVGLNAQFDHRIEADTVSTTTMSTTTVTRAGGGPTTMFVIPPSGAGNTGISWRFFPHSYIKLFEYPIYADTSSKTYTMYFRSASSSAFTVNPLTSTQVGSTTPELYIECEYYADASDADRKLKRSNTANAVDFNTDTNWYGISVTCQPSQSGVLYLRGWYAKPREPSTNQFYMDTTPVVS